MLCVTTSCPIPPCTMPHVPSVPSSVTAAAFPSSSPGVRHPAAGGEKRTFAEGGPAFQSIDSRRSTSGKSRVTGPFPLIRMSVIRLLHSSAFFRIGLDLCVLIGFTIRLSHDSTFHWQKGYVELSKMDLYNVCGAVFTLVCEEFVPVWTATVECGWHHVHRILCSLHIAWPQ